MGSLHQLHHIEAIESEYRRIDLAWLRTQYQLMLWLVVATTASEVCMFFVLRSLDAISISDGWYLLKYILAPMLCNMALCVVATLAMRSRRLTERQKMYTVTLLMVGMALVLYTAHSVFSSLYLVFTVPVILTIAYGDQQLTNVTTLACLLGKVFSDLFLYWDPDRPSPFSTSNMTADFVLSLLLLVFFHGVCIFLIRLERKKNRVGINLERDRQRYQEESMTDGLTRVWNRQALREAFAGLEERRASGRIFLAMMDMDDFKSLNDTFGHSYGDQYLQTLGKVLYSVAGERTVPFRFGGDEFCVLFCGVTLEEARAVCKKIQERFAHDDIHQACRPVSISIGLAEYQPGERPAHLLERADAALYRAKQVDKGSIELGA